jgi:hypothetical protein
MSSIAIIKDNTSIFLVYQFTNHIATLHALVASSTSTATANRIPNYIQIRNCALQHWMNGGLGIWYERQIRKPRTPVALLLFLLCPVLLSSCPLLLEVLTPQTAYPCPPIDARRVVRAVRDDKWLLLAVRGRRGRVWFGWCAVVVTWSHSQRPIHQSRHTCATYSKNLQFQ